MKYAEVTVSKNRSSFVLNQTSKPVGVESKAWKIISRIAVGGTPRELADKAKALGFTLISEPSETSIYFMRGEERRDWNGRVIKTEVAK